jgi:hypothetical protein
METDERPSPPQPKRKRRWLKRIAIAFGIVVLLAATGVTGADVWRRSALEKEQTRLLAPIEQVESEIQGGKPAAEYYRSWVTGSNAWDHLAELMQAHEVAREYDRELWMYDEGEAPPMPQAAVFANAVEGLSDWLNGEEEAEEEESKPTETQLQQWMSETDALAEALKKAENCDCFVPVAKPGDEHWPGYRGAAVIPMVQLINASIARCKLLAQRGDREQSDSELIAATRVWSRYQGLFLIDAMVGIGAYSLLLEFASEQFEAGNISTTSAEVIAAITPPGDDTIIKAMSGEAVWMAYNSRLAEWAMHSPRWFDWVRYDSIPPGEGMFGTEFSGMEQSFIGPINLCRHLSISMEVALDLLGHLDGGKNWDPSGLSRPEYSLFALSPAKPFGLRVELREFHQKAVALRLRIVERSAPLAAQKEQVARLVAAYPGLTLRWEGETVVLGIERQLLEAVEYASTLEPLLPGEMAELVEPFRSRAGADSDEIESHELRLEPRDSPSGDSPESE